MFNTKLEAIIHCLDRLYAEYVFGKFFTEKTAKEELIRFAEFISKEIYVLREYPGLGKTRMQRFLEELFPDRDILRDKKIDKYLLKIEGFRYCSSCDIVLNLIDFSRNPTKSDGLNTQCKSCQLNATKITQPARQAKYKAAKLRAIPSWADMAEISKIYALCPEGHQVDHIVPLQGVNVCGLHVQNNLQYLTKEDNLVKHNKFSG